jgi:hypothetical protein
MNDCGAPATSEGDAPAAEVEHRQGLQDIVELAAREINPD